jgi:hypothetical protein
MAYCAETDPLAERLLFILSSFRDVVNHRKGYSAFWHMSSASDDPILNFFTSGPAETNVPDSATYPNGIGALQNSSSLSHPSTNAHSPQESVQRHGSGLSIESEGEIDFETFWQLSSQQQPGRSINGNTPSVGGVGMTIGLGNSAVDQHRIQGISDSMVPLYGMQEFGGG